MVSIIIPVYNGEKFIERAILSLLNQTYKNIEIIVVDDGSTDNTKEIIEKYDVKYIYQKNSGPSSARNNGIKKAKGEYIALLDADDMYLPNKIETQMNIFKEDSNIHLVYNAVEVIDENDNVINTLRSEQNFSNRKDFLAYLLFRQPIPCLPSIIFKKQCFKDVNYPEDIIYAEDYTFTLNMAKKFNFKYCDEVLYQYRRHSKNLTNNHKLQLKGEIDAIKKIDIKEIFNIVQASTFSELNKKMLLAKILMKIELYKEAKEILENIFNDGIWDEYTLFYLGICYTKLNDLIKAKNVYIKALKKNKKIIEIMNNLACIYALKENNDVAINLLKNALEINKNYMDAKINLHNIFEGKNKFKYTERELRKVLTKYN